MTTSAHRTIALLLLALLIAGGYLLYEQFWLGRQKLYTETTETLQDQLLRYQRLSTQAPELQQRLSAVRQSDAVDDYYLDQESPTLAATELQRRVNQAVQSNGGSLTSSQILPTEEENGFTKVMIRIQMNGDVEALQKALHTLESQRPAVFIDNVQIRARAIRQRVRGNNRQINTRIQLNAQFELAGYLQPGGSS